MNGIDGSVLSGVHIRLYAQTALGKPPYGAMSGKTGHFSMESVLANMYELTAELPGYIEAPEYNVYGNRIKHSLLVAARTPKEIRIEMVPRAVIRGRVTDDAGSPVADTIVELQNETGETIPGAAEAFGNGLGEYRLSAGPGKYLVKVRQNGMAAWMAGRTGTPSAVYSDTFFPSGLVAERATVVEVAAGQTVENIDIRLRRRRKLTVSGKLSGFPVGGCRPSVLVEQKIGARFMNPHTGEAGSDRRFSIPNLESGLYRLSASCGPKYSSAFRTFDLADTDAAGVDLELSAGAEWIGTVEVSGEKAPSQHRLRFKLPGPGYQGMPREFPTDEQGNFFVSGLPARTYEIEVADGPNVYVQSISVDGAAVQNPIDLTQLHPSVMKIVLGRGASVSGTILDREGKPLSRESMVALFLVADAKAIKPDEISVRNGGSYSIAGLRPGKYRLFAAEAEQGVSDLSEWGPVAQLAAEIEIKEGLNLKQDLPLAAGVRKSAKSIGVAVVRPGPVPEVRSTPEVVALLKRLSTGVIAGRILDASGKGVEGVWVATVNAAGKRDFALSEERGEYRFANVAAGSYKVHVRSRWPFLQPTTVPAEIRTDGTEETQYVETYYPGSSDERSARTVTVSAGAETTGIDIQARTGPVLRVSGRVAGVGPGDKTVSVQLVGADNSSLDVPVRNPDGSFEFWRVSPGRYKVQALRSNCRATETFLEVEVGEARVDGLEVPTPRAIEPGKACMPAYIP